jgi:hypothetical protein
MAFCRLKEFCSWKNTPVIFFITVSSDPHTPYAITGVPHACASIGTKPKSSSGGNTKHRAFAYNPMISDRGRLSFQIIFSFEIFLRFLYKALSVLVTRIIFFPFLLKVSTRRSNFLYGIHLPTAR